MAKRYEQTYHINLATDPKDVLATLKRIQADMSKLTTDQKIFDGLKKEFDKVTLLANNFKAELSSGVKSPNDFTRLTGMANNLEVGLNRVVEGIAEIARNENKVFKFKNIEEAKAKIESLQKDLDKIRANVEKSQTNIVPQLQNLEMSEDQAKSMAQQAESQEQLVNALKQEWELRQQIYQQAKERQDNDSLEQRALEQVKNDTKNNKYISNRAFTAQTRGSHFTSSDTAFTEVNRLINEQMIAGLGSSLSFDDIYSNINNSLQNLGVTLGALENNTLHDRLLQTFTAFQQETQEIEENVVNAQRAMSAIGGMNSSGELDLSVGANAAINTFSVTNADLGQRDTINTSIDTINQQIEQMNQVNNLDNFIQSANQAQDSVRNFGESTRDTIVEQQNLAQSNEQIAQTFDDLKRNVKQFLSITNAWQQFRTILNQTYEDVKSLDKAFGSIAMVTEKTVGELWGSYDDYAQMANELGQSTKDVIASSALYYQQGLDTAEALELTENTMKLATLSGADFAKSTEQMTAA